MKGIQGKNQWGHINLLVWQCITKWANGLCEVTEFHDQSQCEEAQAGGIAWIEMFEVEGAGLPFLQEGNYALKLPDLIDKFPTMHFQFK